MPRRRPRRKQLRIGTEPPQLAADLEAAAKEAGIQIPETADRPDAAAGKRYIEHSLDVKLRKVDLKSLATFLSKVETGRSLVLITRLQIRRSFGGDGTSVDVDLTATTYERNQGRQQEAAAQGRRGRKGQGLDHAQREAAPAGQGRRRSQVSAFSSLPSSSTCRCPTALQGFHGEPGGGFGYDMEAKHAGPSLGGA
jgi:hypothetical protein